MAEQESDRIPGIWTDDNGEPNPVSIKRVWRGHTWTDDEVDKLMNNEKVRVSCYSTKKKKHYDMLVKLDHREFTKDGKKIKGIWPDGEFPPRDIPDEICGHVFTDAEKFALKNGEKIHLEGLKSKKGNIFGCDLEWAKDPKNGEMKLNFIFPDN